MNTEIEDPPTQPMQQIQQTPNTQPQAPLYAFSVHPIGKPAHRLDVYQSKVLLIVNTASQCGFTPHFGGLQSLHETYQERGLVVLGFPCNQFGGQEPGSNQDLLGFCQRNYGVDFAMHEKLEVNGTNADPLFDYLTDEAKGFLGKPIRWNFTKFLIDRHGKVLKRYGSMTKPEKIAADIEKLL